jgi:hypothetical protein
VQNSQNYSENVEVFFLKITNLSLQISLSLQIT